MQATIAYYDPPRRPAPDVRPDFTALPLTGRPVTVGNMRVASGGFFHGVVFDVTPGQIAGTVIDDQGTVRDSFQHPVP